MEIHTYQQLKSLQEKETHFWDVIYTETNGLAPIDERFKRGNAYQSLTYTKESDARRVADIYAKKHPSANAHVQIKHWVSKGDEMRTIETINIK